MNPYKDEHNTQWLNSHTMFIGGMFKNDSKGRILENILNDFLERHNGKIIKPKLLDMEIGFRKSLSRGQKKDDAHSVLVMKNYQDFTRLQEKRDNTEDLLIFTNENEPLIHRCCTRKRKRSETYLKERVKKLDSRMQELLSDKFRTALCAYVVFDSYHSMLKVKQQFQESTFDNFRAL